MASRGQRIEGSLRSQVEEWLAEHPGMHRCSEIAAGLGVPTHPVAVACWGLYEQGRATRGLRPAGNGGRPFKTYAGVPAVLETVGGPREDETTNQPAT